MNRFGLKYKCVNLAFLSGIFCIAWRIVTHQMLLPKWQRKCQINFKINYFSVTKFHKLLLKPATHGLLFLFIKKNYLYSNKKMWNLLKTLILFNISCMSDVHVHVTFNDWKQCHQNTINDNKNLFIFPIAIPCKHIWAITFNLRWMI